MGGKALNFLIFVTTACAVQSDLKVSQVYKTLTSRIDIEVKLIKNDLAKIREEFKNDLQELKDEIKDGQQKLNDKIDHICTVSSMDSETSTNTKNTKINAYAVNDMESDKNLIKVLRKAFSEEKKYIRRYKTHIENTLTEYMNYVNASLKTNQKQLLSILNDESSMQVFELQSEQLEEIKENQITFQFMLDEILVNLSENDIKVHEIKQVQSELAQQLGKHVAFHAFNKEKQHTDPGDTVIFDGLAYSSGGGYDKATGIFTCPESGVYMFSVTLVCNEREGSLYLLANLKRNSKTLLMNIMTTNDQYSSGSNLVLLKLEQGETVSVTTHGNKAIVLDNVSTFSGVLLYK